MIHQRKIIFPAQEKMLIKKFFISPMFLPASLRHLALCSAQKLRGVRGAYHILEVVYVELWILHALFGQDSEMLAAFYGWFRVSFVVSAVPGCGVLVFIIGSPLYQYVTKSLIVAMCFQLRIRQNQARGRTRQLLNSMRAWRCWG